MGEVGCFALDLYCDHPLAGGGVCSDRLSQFTGRTYTAAKREALRHGWRCRDKVESPNMPYTKFWLCPNHAKPLRATSHDIVND